MKSFAIGFIMLSFFINSAAIAQEENDGHYYTVTKWRINIPEDGSRAEFNQLMNEWTEKVTQKNDKIISERVLRHASGSDSRDMVIITEYASWNDIDVSQNTQNGLIEAAWPDEAKRKAYMDKLGKYFDSHSDEIYVEIPDGRK